MSISGALAAAGGASFAEDAGYPMATNPFASIGSILNMDQSLGVFSSISGGNTGGGATPSMGNFGDGGAASGGFMAIPGMSNLVSECMASDAKQMQGMLQISSMDGQMPGSNSGGTSAGLGSGGGSLSQLLAELGLSGQNSNSTA